MNVMTTAPLRPIKRAEASARDVDSPVNDMF